MADINTNTSTNTNVRSGGANAGSVFNASGGQRFTVSSRPASVSGGSSYSGGGSSYSGGGSSYSGGGWTGGGGGNEVPYSGGGGGGWFAEAASQPATISTARQAALDAQKRRNVEANGMLEQRGGQAVAASGLSTSASKAKPVVDVEKAKPLKKKRLAKMTPVTAVSGDAPIDVSSEVAPKAPATKAKANELVKPAPAARTSVTPETTPAKPAAAKSPGKKASAKPRDKAATSKNPAAAAKPAAPKKPVTAAKPATVAAAKKRRLKPAERFEQRDGIPTGRVKDKELSDQFRLIDAARRAQAVLDATNARRDERSLGESLFDIDRSEASQVPSDEMQEAMDVYEREMGREMNQSDRPRSFREYDKNNKPESDPQDTLFRQWVDVSKAKGSKRKQLSILEELGDQMSSYDYEQVEDLGPEGDRFGDFDTQDKGFVSEIDTEKESLRQKNLRVARNFIKRRLLNPMALHIEGEYVETMSEPSGKRGKVRTYGRKRFSANVEKTIGKVRELYGGCSIWNVLQLVQLRAGLGVDRNGKIANVDPDKFKLTEDQFIELCNDIIESQRRYGHPMGIVRGKPGGRGVRDDSGRYVVVAKTRCFPLGYIPLSLLHDLRNSNSALAGKSDKQIMTAMANDWINTTYPELCANTGGNLMYQALAIENMMRAVMSIDGKNPAYLDIPEVVERQTLMAMRAERASATDPDLIVGIEARQKADEKSLMVWKAKHQKEDGLRDADGNIVSVAARRAARKIDNGARSICTLTKAAGAANLMVMVSSVPETLVAEGQMSFSSLLSDALFKGQHGELAKQYAFTPELQRLSQDKRTIEALSIADSLYNIGGHDAIDAFLSDVDDSGRAKYQMTKADFRRFLQDYGFIGSGPTISDRIRQVFKVKPGEESAFMANAQLVADSLDSRFIGGSSLFKTREARQFVQLSMAEMGRSAAHGREAYDSSQVLQWGQGSTGGEELVRSLLQTDAGREAFMTQGITSLARRSPIQNQVRAVMSANGLTQLAVRRMFGTFVEYGIQKMVRQIPLSNTISYMTAVGLDRWGRKVSETSAEGSIGQKLGDMAQSNMRYQVGGTLEFREGLAKNFRYDMVMAGTEMAKALVIYGILQALGGLFPPEEPKDRYTLSEWKIGDGEDALPIKFAWWMDDLAGLGLPLGFCISLFEDNGGWSDPDALTTATNCFINSVANFNSGTTVMSAIDFVNNPRSKLDKMFLLDSMEDDEWAITAFEHNFWDLIGDMTPTIAKQLIPWSRDYLFKGDADQHTPYREYDVGEGSRYDMDTARKEYRVKDVDSLRDTVRREDSQSNILLSIFSDIFFKGDGTGYWYAEMPLRTTPDDYAMTLYNRFFLSTDDLTSDQGERERICNQKAEDLVHYIENNYQNATQAVLDGFAINYDAKANATRYCLEQIDALETDFQRHKADGLIGSFNEALSALNANKDHYWDLINEFFTNKDIPTRVPLYVYQESDSETRYVDEDNNPRNFIESLLDPNVHAERYPYGNVPGISPASSPRTEGKAYNFEEPTYWSRIASSLVDENGEPAGLNSGAIYDQAGDMTVSMGRNAGKNMRELAWGGLGTNSGKDGANESLAIGREGVATTDVRPLRIMEERQPDILKDLDKLREQLGLTTGKSEDKQSDKTSPGSSSGGGGSSYGRRSYGYGYGGGGYYASGRYYGSGGYYSNYGGSSSSYNPKIYSNPKNVYGTRASGLSVKQPYKATTTYLRPAFYTKGSREAYKRSDI